MRMQKQVGYETRRKVSEDEIMNIVVYGLQWDKENINLSFAF
jgi:hypothetical protein